MFLTALVLIPYLAVFSFIIYRFQFYRPEGINRALSILLFYVKVIAGILFGYFYSIYGHGGDTFTFFETSRMITSLIMEDPGKFLRAVSGLGDQTDLQSFYAGLRGWHTYEPYFNDSRTIIRINALVGLISFGKYYVHSVFFSFLSFTGSIGLFRFFSIMSEIPRSRLIIPAFLIPSALFWMSGANKEGLLSLVMGLSLYQFSLIIKGKEKLVHLIIFFLLSLLFIHIKAYLLVMLLPGLVAMAWSARNLHARSWMKYVLIYAGFFIGISLASVILERADAFQVLHSKRYNFESFVESAPQDSKSYYEAVDFDPDPVSVLKASVPALFSTLVRPTITDAEGVKGWLVVVEGVMILLFLLYGIVRTSRLSVNLNSNLLWFCIFFVATNYMLIGLTTPVFGAIVRYKAPVLPFLVMIPVILMTRGYEDRDYNFDVNKNPTRSL
jgi:hypothetical protein